MKQLYQTVNLVARFVVLKRVEHSELLPIILLMEKIVQIRVRNIVKKKEDLRVVEERLRRPRRLVEIAVVIPDATRSPLNLQGSLD